MIGSAQTVREGLQNLLDQTQADEIMLVCDVHDPALRLRSLSIAAEIMHAATPSVHGEAKYPDAASDALTAPRINNLCLEFV